MVKPLFLAIAAVPIILAILIAIPMIVNPQIPFSATNAEDRISIEFTKQSLEKISLGVTDRITPLKTEILTIDNDGNAKYLETTGNVNEPEKTAKLDSEYVKRLTALIKETGFMKIPTETIQPDEDVKNYDRYTFKVTLNGQTKQIQWAEQNATSTFIPPLISNVQSEMHNATLKVRQN